MYECYLLPMYEYLCKMQIFPHPSHKIPYAILDTCLQTDEVIWNFDNITDTYLQ